jgi:SAM-dependent methyltransferase
MPDNSLNSACRHAPAAARNREPILKVLQQVLPPTGTVLEVASGTGEHAIFFAPRLKSHIWQPSDPSSEMVASIAAWQQEWPANNLRSPWQLDVRDSTWPVEGDRPELPINAIVCINMIHIAPWAACLGLLAGAGRILPPGGILYLYGPYKQNGEHTAPSNEFFDETLRSQNSEWGVRNLEDVVAAAKAENLLLSETIPMPANNLSVIFQHQ